MNGDATVSWRELYADTVARVGSQTEARWLCETAAGCLPAEWAGLQVEPATRRAVAALDRMLARRAEGEPLQYVLGAWGFRTLDLAVDGRVLIPRPETELVVEVALAEARAWLARVAERPLVTADLGTGSGAIALSLAAELPLGAVRVWATDVDADALAVAGANLAGAGRRPAVHVRLAEGTWFTALPPELMGGLGLVVSNPPYIAEGDPDVAASVTDWEPHHALFAGPDGLDALRQIITEAPAWLAPGGVLVCEIGARQGPVVHRLARAAGFTGVEIRPDLAGRDRVLVARRP